MTVQIQYNTVIGAIAGLTISGVNIKDIDEIPENAEMQLPVLFPNPDDPVTDIDFQFASFGTMGAAKMDLSYTLNYLYLHAKVGSGLSVNSVLSGLMTNLAAIMVKFAENDQLSGAVEVKLNSLPAVRVIEGPNGTQFHGVALTFRVLEHMQ